MNTIWGESESIENVAEGIDLVTTESHGGIVLSAERAAQIPADIQPFGGCRRHWEEDCDWAVPYLVFAEEFFKHDGERFAFLTKAARKTLQYGSASILQLIDDKALTDERIAHDKASQHD